MLEGGPDESELDGEINRLLDGGLNESELVGKVNSSSTADGMKTKSTAR